MTKKVVAILCSDLHLRDRVPPARSAEPDWYAAMGRTLYQLKAEQKRCDWCRIIIAGDVFHRWNPSPELINWYISLKIPDVYAVPGQHDLPFHALADIKKSAYWTLVMAGAIKHIDKPMLIGQSYPWMVHPFPWGVPVEFPEGYGQDPDTKHLAVVHAYLHNGGETAFVDAPASAHVKAYAEKLKGFDVAVFGDNHTAFQTKAGGCTIVNSGGMIPANSDDRDKSCGYSLLYGDGTVERKEFDTSLDLWVDESVAASIQADSEHSRELVEALTKLATAGVDYPQSIRNAIETLAVRPGVQRYLLESIG